MSSGTAVNVESPGPGFSNDPLHMLGSNPDLNFNLCDFVSTTKAEALLMVMTFAMRHSLTGVAVVDLLQIINKLFEREVVPDTKHLFSKVFSKSCELTKFHFYCTFCQTYVGNYCKGFDEKEKKCPQCHSVCNLDNLDEGNFFISVPLAPQIQCLLEKLDGTDVLSYRMSRKMTNRESICDIYDGECYRQISQPGKILSKPENFSYNFNCDGSSVFNSSSFSIWPIQIMINELPPSERGKHLILAGLWFGKGHPNMDIFLGHFVEEAKMLTELGVKWRKKDKTIVTSKIVGICCCVDSVARPAMQNSTQYNGYFGCSWCYHPGMLVSGQVKYPVSEVEYADRTDRGMLNDMKTALRERIIYNGVKGPSPLINLPYFGIVWGFTPDYMHCVLLGVTRQLTELWLQYANEECYIGSPSCLAVIDSRLLSIKPPQNMARLPRSVKDRKYWKASEWRNWLLFYSLPCLKGILPERYLKHFALLVEAIYLPLQSQILPQDVNNADILLLEFVVKLQSLCGEANMTSNVHLLLHLAKSVKLWGPLWAHSAFVFESGNGKLLQLVKGTKGVAKQVVNKFLLYKAIPLFKEIHNIKTSIAEFCTKLTDYPELQASDTSNGITLLGPGYVQSSLGQEEQTLFREAGKA
ncbi:hypothetical protein HHUSO_G4649 [Huso huso]|uniref:Uncharacterized protein n=1 Tax=Huso huso TaxID=61971 RepID=A0ABR1A5H2_HUSHU